MGDEDAISLRDKLREMVFVETAIAARDAEDVPQGNSKRDEQVKAIMEATGTDLSAARNAMLKIQMRRGAGAMRIATVSQACSSTLRKSAGQNGKGPTDCKFDAAGDAAEGKTLGKVVGPNDRPSSEEVEEAKSGAKRVQRMARAARRIAKRRLHGCGKRAEEGEEKACAADKRTADNMAKLRPKRFAHSDQLKARSNIIAEMYESCIAAGSSKSTCLLRAKSHRKQLRKVKLAGDVEAMIYRRAVELLSLEENECGEDSKEICKSTNKEVLERRLGKTAANGDISGKMFDVLRMQAMPVSDAAEDFATCLEAAGKKEWPTEDTDASVKCKRVAKDKFDKLIGKRQNDLDTEAWSKKAKKIEKLAKAKFKGLTTKFNVSIEEIDTIYQHDGSCSEAVVKQAKDEVNEAANSALADARKRHLREDEQPSASTTAESKDEISGKCTIYLKTKLKKHLAESVADAMNALSIRNKRQLASNSWSSAPSVEEQYYGEESENGSETEKGGFGWVPIAWIGGVALAVVGVVIGLFVYSSKKGKAEGTVSVAIEMSAEPDPFAARGRTESVNPLHAHQ